VKRAIAAIGQKVDRNNNTSGNSSSSSPGGYGSTGSHGY
jgi:hypothetical protein